MDKLARGDVIQRTGDKRSIGVDHWSLREKYSV